jgi:hypothetical protein
MLEMEEAYSTPQKAVVGEPVGKRPLWRYSHRWEVNIKDKDKFNVQNI